MNFFFTNAGWMKFHEGNPLGLKSHREKEHVQIDSFSCYFVVFLKKTFILTTWNIAIILADQKSIKI